MSRLVLERKVTMLSKELATQEAKTYLIKVATSIIVMNLIVVTVLVMGSELAGIMAWRGLKRWRIMMRAK